MCQSLEEGGKRCPSCDVINRRGKDRAAYKAKKLSTTGAVSTPSISEMELARAGVGCSIREDSIASGLSGNTDFLFKLAAVRKNIKIFEMQKGRDVLVESNLVSEVVTIEELESSIRGIGAIVDARARVLVNIDGNEIARVKQELDQLLKIARKKSKAKLKRITKAQGGSEVEVSTDVDTENRVSDGNSKISDAVASMIRDKLLILESGATVEVVGLLGNLKRGYLQALGEVRNMGLDLDSEGLITLEVKGFFPSNWLEGIKFSLNPSSNDSISSLSFRDVLTLIQNDFSILPILPALEKEFVSRRGRGIRRESNKVGQEFNLEPYGIEDFEKLGNSGSTKNPFSLGSLGYVVEGYFIDRFIGRVPAAIRLQIESSNDIDLVSKNIGTAGEFGALLWEPLSCGLDAISGQRLHLGGLVGVGSGRSRHDDDMRQFVLGLLAVLEI